MKVKKNKINKLLEFVQNYSAATETIDHYAYFANIVESFYENFYDEFPIEMREQLDMLIGDIEIINALALDDWEKADSPPVWNAWYTGYKKDADDLRKQLENILTGVQKKYIENLK